jgi:hypothetical protein
MQISTSAMKGICPALAGIFGKPTNFQKLDSFTNSIKRIINQIIGKCNRKKNIVSPK